MADRTDLSRTGNALCFELVGDAPVTDASSNISKIRRTTGAVSGSGSSVRRRVPAGASNGSGGGARCR